MKRSYVIAGLIALGVGAWLATGVFDVPSTNESASGNGAEAASNGGPRADVSTSSAANDAADIEAVGGTLPAVQVVTLSAEAHQRTIVVFGRTRADRRVDMRAETQGRVAEIFVKKGDRVEEGEVLVRLATDDREARLRRAEALVNQRSVTYKASQALRRDGFRPETRIAEDLALLEEARAMLAAVELDIDRTKIVAPFAGIVENVPVEVGDYMQTGGPDGSSIVATVIDLEPIVVVASVTERDASAISLGAAAEVRLSTGERLPGVVSYIARTANPQTRTFDVEIEVANPGSAVPDGLTADVRLDAGTVVAHRVTPSVLTLSDEGKLGIKIVDEENRVAFRRVSIVDDTPNGIWLTGLPEAATVIVVGQEFVREGQKIQPQPMTSAAAAVSATSEAAITPPVEAID